MAVELFSEETSTVNNLGPRETVKVALLRFPEAAALNPEELEKAVDRILEQSDPETASAAAPGMVRLIDENIRVFIQVYMKKMPSVDELLGGAGKQFPPGWIEKRRQELDELVQPANKNNDDDFGNFLAKIRVDLITKGYVELEKEYMEEDVQLI